MLDECVPRRLAAHLAAGHEVKTVPQAGWASIKNGRLLALAENVFDAFVTVDRNLSFQQSFAGRNLAVLVLAAKSSRFQDLLPLVPKILIALTTIKPGEISVVSI